MWNLPVASFSISACVKTQFPLRLRLYSKELAFNLWRYVKAFCTKETGFRSLGYCSAWSDGMQRTGPESPCCWHLVSIAETTLQTAVRVPSSHRWYCSLFKDLSLCAGHLHREAALWSAPNPPHAERGQSCWLWRVPAPSRSPRGTGRCLVFDASPLCVEGVAPLQLLQVPVSFKPCRFNDNFSNL